MLHRSISAIHKLRLYFFFAITVCFFVVAGLNPIDVGKYWGAGFSSAIGMSTSVVENPFNKLALDLKTKEDALNQREQALIAKETALTVPYDFSQALLLRLMAVGIIVLFVLILTNFILDYKRRRNEKKTV